MVNICVFGGIDAICSDCANYMKNLGPIDISEANWIDGLPTADGKNCGDYVKIDKPLNNKK